MRAALKGTVLNMQPTVIKGIVHKKNLTRINFFLVLDTKEDNLKNVGNQTVAGP